MAEIIPNQNCNVPDKRRLANLLNVSVEDFHRKIKRAILADIRHDLGNINFCTNPDIGICLSGNLCLKCSKTNESICLDFQISIYQEE